MSNSDFDPFAQFSQTLEKRPDPKPYVPKVASPLKLRDGDGPNPPTPAGGSKKRPKLVWWIAAFYLFAFVSTLLSFAAYRKDWFRLRAEDQAFLSELGPLFYLVALILTSINLYAVIRLFQLRAVAAKLLLLTFSAGLINTLWYALTTSWLKIMLNRPSGLIGFLLGTFINAGICYYAYRLKQKGTLS